MNAEDKALRSKMTPRPWAIHVKTRNALNHLRRHAPQYLHDYHLMVEAQLRVDLAQSEAQRATQRWLKLGAK